MDSGKRTQSQFDANSAPDIVQGTSAKRVRGDTDDDDKDTLVPIVTVEVAETTLHYLALRATGIHHVTSELPPALAMIVAKYGLVNHYELGREFERLGNWKEAFPNFELAMNDLDDVSKDGDATYRVALCYLAGLNVVKVNATKAVTLLRLAIEREAIWPIRF